MLIGVFGECCGVHVGDVGSYEVVVLYQLDAVVVGCFLYFGVCRHV